MSHTFKNPSRDNLRPVHRFISHWPKSCKTANTEFKNSVFKSRKKKCISMVKKIMISMFTDAVKENVIFLFACHNDRPIYARVIQPF